MVVTEKCDVYSFGVAALEILMGKHPGDLLSSLTSSFIRNSTVNDVLDPRLSLPIDRLVEWDIVMVIRLAFSCIRSNPKSRPTMQSVSQQFLVRRMPLPKPLHLISLSRGKLGLWDCGAYTSQSSSIAWNINNRALSKISVRSSVTPWLIKGRCWSKDFEVSVMPFPSRRFFLVAEVFSVVGKQGPGSEPLAKDDNFTDQSNPTSAIGSKGFNVLSVQAQQQAVSSL
ncbi:hypothetical protein LguiB_012788 [Lonicera macranthoides]